MLLQGRANLPENPTLLEYSLLFTNSKTDEQDGGGLFLFGNLEMMRAPNQTATTILALCVFASCVCSFGCVHPNLPSVRHQRENPTSLDPFSFVPAESLASTEPVTGEPLMRMSSPTTSNVRVPGGPIECPPDDPAHVRTGALAQFLYNHEEHHEPDVPWPRFHPLPTNPVYGR